MATDQVQVKPVHTPRHEVLFEQQLGRAVGRIRFLDVTAALLALAAGTLLYALVVISLDRWLVLSGAARQAVLVLYLLTACAFLGWFLVRPLCRRVNPYYAAKRLERTLPEAKNSVVNWLDLRGESLPAAIRSAVGQRAAHDAARADLDEAVSGRRAAWSGGAAGLLFVVLLVTLGLLGPAQFWSLLGRAFGPFSAGGIQTRTWIQLHHPQDGDAIVPMERSVPFAAAIGGKVPAPNRPDSPRLLFRYRQTDPYEERPLERERENEWITTLPANQVHNGFWYKLAAGDAETPEYQVRVRATPLVERIDVLYHYRPYTGWKDATSDDPNLEALRGTEVTLTAHTNRPVQSGRCLVEGKGFQDKILGESIAGDPQALRFQFVMERAGHYRIEFTSSEGEPSSPHLPYQIKVLPDRPPEVMLKKPGQDITLPANGLLALEGAANDDLGVAGMTLRLQALDGPKTLEAKPYRPGKSFKLPDGGYPKMLVYKDAVELDKLKDEAGQPFALKAKMVLEYWLEAADACDYPKPNIGESTHYKVTIGEPDKDQKNQEQDRDQAKQEQQKHDHQQDKQLEKENQQRKEANQRNQEPEKNDNPQQNGQQDDKKDGKEQRDPQADNTEQKLENEFKKQDQQNKQKGTEKPKDDGQQRSEPKDDKDKQQPQAGQGKGKQGDKPGTGAPEGKSEPGKDKDQGAKQDGQPGIDKKAGSQGGNQQNKDGAQNGELVPKPSEQNDGDQQPDNSKPEQGAGKGSKDGSKPQAAQPKGPGDSKQNEKPDQGQGKGPGQAERTDQRPQGTAKPADERPSPAVGKDKPKAGTEPKQAPGKGPQGSGQKAPKKDATGKTNAGATKPDQKKKDDAAGGSGAEPPKGKSNDPKENAGGGTNQNDQKKATPKNGSQSGSGTKGQKPGEKATAQDIAKLAEQMANEQGQKREDAAKQLAEAARNAKDQKAREQAAKALQEAQRDPQTGQPVPSTSKQAPKKDGQAPKDGNGPGQNKKPPDQKTNQTGAGKNGDGKKHNQPREPKDGGTSQGPGKGKQEGQPGQGTGGGKTSQQRGDDEPPDFNGAPPDARDRLKKGELLLERFDKLKAEAKDKFLKDAKISDADLNRLREDIARRKRQQTEKPEKVTRPTGPGSRADKAASAVKGVGKPRAADTRYGGAGSPPPELRDSYREFTGREQKK